MGVARIRAIAIVLLTVAAAPACGSGGGQAPAHLAVQAAVRRGACLPVHPGLVPYRGRLVLVRSGGGRVRLLAGGRGRVRADVTPGAYALLAPLSGSTVHLELDGREVAVAGNRYPLRIGAGQTARLAVVILPRRGECTSGGAGA